MPCISVLNYLEGLTLSESACVSLLWVPFCLLVNVSISLLSVTLWEFVSTKQTSFVIVQWLGYSTLTSISGWRSKILPQDTAGQSDLRFWEQGNVYAEVPFGSSAEDQISLQSLTEIQGFRAGIESCQDQEHL